MDWKFGAGASEAVARPIQQRPSSIEAFWLGREEREVRALRKERVLRKEGLRDSVDFAMEGRDFGAWGEGKATIAGTEPDLIHEQKFLLENLIRWERDLNV
ncbi:hypothetical protein MRB53_035905 [Persea americana]|uniref:Uncharacterized protein n=1 Tax=Persea americana TaxID=3435 RepID=A0ACC2K678_PERAE|nr:hypothetical protein MRB53_035905 [Persea americana]|eukprot:TRINITY_DN12324_c0_g2_i1.p1 TRINITY_DN12324_c0_g2~~TRINITY_DN12324_c0_g2_i1.p1  ORF type:complete len:101 (+),score=29.34 TRINITY_DN12324_c0_g2_i1:117-419(+)